MNLTLIAGARPNFMKVAPIIHSILRAQEQGKDLNYRLVHTGQHYDVRMSQTFFEELNIPDPDVNLECGGGTQAEQTGAIMIAFERELTNNPADYVLVVGDVTSTMACSIVARKLNIEVIHVEAGIRSDDLTMPEEINRIVTDSITNLYFTTTEDASKNLINSGVPLNKIHFVGNVMIDTLLSNMNKFKKPHWWAELKLEPQKYIVMTLHRPSNVDEEQKLRLLIQEIVDASCGLSIVFPVHPRTQKILKKLNIIAENLHYVAPLGYLTFNYLVKNAKAVVTDSGGITEETTVMGVPCMTLRNNTERPETILKGTNELLGTTTEAIKPAFKKLFDGKWKRGSQIDKWDGNAANRIIDVILKLNKLS